MVESTTNGGNADGSASLQRLSPPPSSLPEQPVDGSAAPPAPAHTLLWSKSKVYIHPSPYAKHNVPGYLALVRQGAARPGATILLSFLPESLVEQRQELEKFVRIEYTTSAGGDDDATPGTCQKSLDAVEVVEEDESELIAEPPATANYAFSLPITSLYSFTVKPPTISCWYGSVTLNQVGGVSLPTLHFHDDESKSTILSMHRARSATSSSSSANSAGPSSVSGPGSVDGRPTSGGGSAASSMHGPPSPVPIWGGDELLHQLRKYASVHRSVIDPALFLVNPSRSDLELHSTPLFDDDAIDAPSQAGPSSSASSSWRQDFPDDPFSPTYPMLGRSPRTSALHQSMPLGASPKRHEVSMDNLTLWAKSTRLSVLSSFANLTQQARHASHAVLSHPLAKPYVPHLPGPVQSFAHAGPIPLGPNDGEWEWRKSTIANNSGTGEYYDSARVYLAKWARLVAEEGERNRRREERLGIAPDEADGRHGTSRNGADSTIEGSELGAFELLEKMHDFPRPRSERRDRLTDLTTAPTEGASTPSTPSPAMSLEEWRSMFDSGTGLPLHSIQEIRHRIFVTGLTNEARKEAWPLLLDAVPFDSTTEERTALWQQREVEYYRFKAHWQTDDDLINSDAIKEQRHRIRVDCLRTDRSQPMFASTPMMAPVGRGQGEATAENPNVQKLGEILLTYGFWEAESCRLASERHKAEALHSGFADGDGAAAPAMAYEEGGLAGYVQGMSDLCSPLYVICEGDEVKTFWCFVGFMERVKSNFYRDQSGMKTQLLLLQKLISVMDPKLYGHLERSDSLNLFFCFRWLLVCFKREFPFDDTLKIWECCWSAEPSSSPSSSSHSSDSTSGAPTSSSSAQRQEHSEWGLTPNLPLFIALAILEVHRDVLLRYLENFDEILQYLNGLSQGGLDVDECLARAEVLVKAFREVVARGAARRNTNSDGANTNANANANANVTAFIDGFLEEEIRKLVG
ncbi:GTPase activating protein [Thecaphora frezii]